MFKGVDHINIVVSDLERSIGFYSGFLGFKLKGTRVLQGAWIEQVSGIDNVRATVAFMEFEDSPAPRLELLCYESPSGQHLGQNSIANTIGLRHVAFCVSDIDAVYAALKGNGVEFVCAPMSVQAGVVQGIPAGKRLCYFKDPDGTLLEICSYGNAG